MAGKRSRPRTAAQTRAARDAILHYHRTRHLRPKCGARRRSDGEPCCRVAMANGRCYMHGGKTPRGKDWHKPVWPNGNAPPTVWTRKLNRKLADLKRAQDARRLRLLGMSVDERAAYEKWLVDHPPGSTRGSKRRRAARAAIAEDRPQVVDLELTRIEARIVELKAQLAALKGEDHDEEVSSGNAP